MGSHSYHNYPKNNPLNFLLAGFLFVVFILCLMFSSCSPTKRLGGLAAKHPDAALKVCANMFPVKVETVTNTEYVAGATVYDTSVVYVDCDSVIKSANSTNVNGSQKVLTKLVRVPCPPSTHRVDSVFKTITITKTDTKQIKLLEKNLVASESDAERFKKQRNTFMWITGILGVLLLGGAALKIFTKRLG